MVKGVPTLGHDVWLLACDAVVAAHTLDADRTLVDVVIVVELRDNELHLGGGRRGGAMRRQGARSGCALQVGGVRGRGTGEGGEGMRAGPTRRLLTLTASTEGRVGARTDG